MSELCHFCDSEMRPAGGDYLRCPHCDSPCTASTPLQECPKCALMNKRTGKP